MATLNLSSAQPSLSREDPGGLQLGCTLKNLLRVVGIITLCLLVLQYCVSLGLLNSTQYNLVLNSTQYNIVYNQTNSKQTTISDLRSPNVTNKLDPNNQQNAAPQKEIPAREKKGRRKRRFKNWVMPFEEVNKSSSSLPHLPPGVPPYCPIIPPGLKGQVAVLNYSLGSFHELGKAHPELEFGGRWHPLNCTARDKVAIIVSYRDREEHLLLFLQHMHPFLQKQQLDYGIYVAEMAGPTKFNRAMMFNVGYAKAQKDYDWQCYVFHDIDLLPENDNNLYSCPLNPRHMTVGIDKNNYSSPYDTLAGGVVAIRKEQFEKMNGFSNMFFGWGGEDDDFYNRIVSHGYKLTRYPGEIGRYKWLRHIKAKPSADRMKYLRTGRKRNKKDGINSLQYTLLNSEERKLYSWIYVKVDKDKIRSG